MWLGIFTGTYIWISKEAGVWKSTVSNPALSLVETVDLPWSKIKISVQYSVKQGRGVRVDCFQSWSKIASVYTINISRELAKCFGGKIPYRDKRNVLLPYEDEQEFKVRNFFYYIYSYFI